MWPEFRNVSLNGKYRPMKNPLFYSILSFFGLIIFYFLTMAGLSRSWAVTLNQFKNLWLWMAAISLSFSAQVYLFLSLRKIAGETAGGRLISASATSSSLSMVACCAHHAADFLPLLGFSALSLFLVNYQKPLLILSLTLNILGILLMLRKLLASKL